jgi:hypothetical protein
MQYDHWMGREITTRQRSTQQSPADKLARAQRKWEKFDALKLHVNEMVQDINAKWLIHARDTGIDGAGKFRIEIRFGYDGRAFGKMQFFGKRRAVRACHEA